MKRGVYVSSHQERFPFPFDQPHYGYSNNLKPLDGCLGFQVTTQYCQEMDYKRQLLRDHPARCYQNLSPTFEAQWEVVDLVLHQLAEFYPGHFGLDDSSEIWTFHNKLLDECTQFTFGDAATLDVDPLDFAGRQVQEDLILLSQRDDDLILDAGQLCFPGNWSLMFNVGLPFLAIHEPVPVLSESGLADKIKRFLLRIDADLPWTRLNWSMNVGCRLDTSPETFDVWGSARDCVVQATVGEQVYLRVEEQNLFRLPASHALLFTIHTYLQSLARVACNRTWAKHLHGVLTSLPENIAEYKGLSTYMPEVISYLEARMCTEHR